MFSITPSGQSPLAAMAMRYGDRLAAGLMESGARIERSLQEATENRQLQGLSAGLSTINPETADWPQQAIAIAGQFPEAMRLPRGQAMIALGADAHNRWAQTQAAIAQSNRTFERQKSLLGLRNQYRPNGEVDLLSADGLPSNEAGTPLAPPAPGFSFGAGMPRLQQAAPEEGADISPQPVQGDSPSETLMGIPPTLSGASAAGNPNSLLGRALGPLREAQRVTGRKPTMSQVASAIAAERRAEQSRAMQEDRQSEARLAREETAAARRERDESRVLSEDLRRESAQISSRLRLIRSRIEDFRQDLSQLMKANDAKERMADTEASKAEYNSYFKEKADIQRAIEKLGAEETELINALDRIGAPGAAVTPSTDTPAQPSTMAPRVRRYDPFTGRF